MKVFDAIKGFFISLRTTLWLLVLILLLFLSGAVLMPTEQQYQGLMFLPLFHWLKTMPPGITWWLWVCIIVLFILALNTLICSIDSLFRKRRAGGWILLIAPQIIHTGFLFVLLAHLLDASMGSKYMARVMEGSTIRLDHHRSLRISHISPFIDNAGYLRGWRVGVEYLDDGEVIEKGLVEPNRPFLESGMNVIVKDVRMAPYRMALIQISSEPGALWALGGGVLMMAGIIILILFKIRVEK